MARKYDSGDVLSIDHAGFSLYDIRGWSLDELARNGAKLILETALREEVLDHLGRDRYERSSDD
ncbi:hypothetical protein K8I28_15385 [bacterium]|nr:hypothetical protein [bacterium]